MGNLAKVQAERGNYNAAIHSINNALMWQKENLGENHFDYIISLRKKAEILLAAKKTGDAVKQFKVYFYKEREYIASNFAYMTENERLNFWYSQKPLVDKCFALEDADPDFLFDVAVFSKSVLILANENFASMAFSDQEMKAIYSEIISLKSELLVAKPDLRNKIQEKIDLLEARFAELNPRYKQFVSNLAIDREKIEKSLKNKDDAVVEFIYYGNGDDMRYAALVLQKNKSVQFVPLFTQSEIEDYKIRGLSVTLRINSSRTSLKGGLFADTVLSEMVWKKIVDIVPKNSNVYFVPDGIFYNLGIEYMCFWRDDLRFYRLTNSATIARATTRKSTSALIAGGFDYNDTSAVTAFADSLPDRTGSRFFNQQGVLTNWKNLKSSLAEVDSVANVLQSSGMDVIKITSSQG